MNRVRMSKGSNAKWGKYELGSDFSRWFLLKNFFKASGTLGSFLSASNTYSLNRIGSNLARPVYSDQ